MDKIIKLFRFTGDALMVISRMFMVNKIKTSSSVSGLSLKTQLIYLIVYVCRYLDLYTVKYTQEKFRVTHILYLNIYNSIFKVFLISFQLYIISLIAGKYKKTYYKKYDNFPLSVLLCICGLISLIITISQPVFFIKDMLYTLSLCLEAVAILPQLVMTQESEDCESMTSKYIFFLGLYRLNYFVYFILSKINGGNVDYLMIFTSLIQTALYVDFFKVYYSYVLSKNGSFKRMINK